MSRPSPFSIAATLDPAWISHQPGGWFDTPYIALTTTLLAEAELRLVPFLIVRPTTIDRLAAEVTVAGSAGSVFRVGIYRNRRDGFLFPDELVVDAGTIDGTNATLQEIALTPRTLEPAVYWIGGVNQGAAVTRATIRTQNVAIPNMPGGLAANKASTAGYHAAQASVTGALPATWAGTVSAVAGPAPRVQFRTMAATAVG